MPPPKGDALTDRCIFLTCTMRSGSTLLSRMLNAHPAVAMSYDSVHFFRFGYQRYDPISNPDNFKRLFRDMAHRLYNRFEIELDQEACVAHMGTSNLSYGQAYVSILRSLFSYTGKKILGDQDSLAWTKIPAFLSMCPNGKVIAIIRDPRDVVTSFKQMTIAPGNDYLISLFNVVDLANHAFRYRAQYPDRVHVVRFERLKTHTEEELRSLSTFLEIDYTPKMIEEANFTDHAGNLWDAQGHLTFQGETEWLAPVGRWQRRIEPEDLFLCEWIAGKQIAQFGLGLDGRVHPQSVFDNAIAKITSSPLLREAFKRWCDLGEGVERFPLDPVAPNNWDPAEVKHPEAFLKEATS
jgi:hypothetical protein